MRHFAGMDAIMSISGKETRRRLIEIAMELFRENGYEKTSVQQICDTADLTRNAFYYHFKTKDDILVAFFRETLLESDIPIDVLLETTTFDKLLHLYHACMWVFQNEGVDVMRNYIRIKISGSLPTPSRKSFLESYAPPLIQQCQKEGTISAALSADRVASLIEKMMSGEISIWCEAGGTYDLAETCRKDLVEILRPPATQ